MRKVVIQALAEDIGRGDITTRSFVPARRTATATIFAKEPAVVCGLKVAAEVFRRLDPRARIRFVSRDGRRVNKGGVLLRVRARARALLTGERTALNLLQRLCGVATVTAEFVRRVRGTRARILDTRKTTPGLRALEKYAVACGGGTNHRFGLFDAVLIKDNHLSFGRPSADVIRGLKRRGYRVEIEAQSMSEVRAFADLPIDVIMLDNFALPSMRRAVRWLRRHRPRLKIEASGGVNLKTAGRIARTGVDFISVGALTHSVRSIDLSMDIE